jgi:hypothetical protein
VIKLLGLGVVLAAALIAGCGSKCSGTFNCPNDSGATYTFAPSGLSAPLTGVSADPPCTAKLFAVDGGPPQIQVTAGQPAGITACHLHGTLPGGRTATATVTFQPLQDTCCPGYTASVAGFTLTDAGADGP